MRGAGRETILGGRYARGLRALGAVFHVERYRLSFSQDFETFRLDLGEVDEYVLSAVRGGDEAKAFRLVEPLDSTCSHFDLPLK